MKPAWDQLGDAFAGHKDVVIGDVDCTAGGGRPVCTAQGVRGYPTIKHFTAGEAEGTKYGGGRSFDALKAFVDANLVSADGGATEKDEV
jgi:hypothetical protein